MKKIIISVFSIVALFIFVSPAFASTVFTDTFTDTDATSVTSHDSNWYLPVETPMTIESNQLDADSGGANAIYQAFPQQDGCVSMDIENPGGDNFIDLYIRSGITGPLDVSHNPLVQFFFDTSSSGFTQLYGDGLSDSERDFSGLSGSTHNLLLCETGTNIVWYIDNIEQGSYTDPNTPTSGYYSFGVSSGTIMDNFKILNSDPNRVSNEISASPSSSSVSVGTPFNVDVTLNSASDSAFNAAQSTVTVSSNLSVTGIHNAISNACNFQYTKHPTPTNPSFAGAIFGGSSTGCTVYTMTLTPTATGTGTIAFTNGSIKAYSDNSEILTGVQNGSYTIGNGPTPTPTSGVSQLTVTSPLLTYLTDYTLSGGKDSAITHVFINSSETGVTFPTSTTWSVPETLSLGDNTYTIYGSDDDSNQTATQTIDVNRHTLGDIDGDGVTDLTDASLFAVDWGKTSGLTYILSDMNGDGNADLTDLSILAKLEE